MRKGGRDKSKYKVRESSYSLSPQVVSDPVGYGFVIRGSRPVYVHTIDPSGPAAAAGLKVHIQSYGIPFCRWHTLPNTDLLV